MGKGILVSPTADGNLLLGPTSIDFEDDKILSVTGNTCPRGEKYAEDECLAPKRTITSTVKCSDGSVLHVKTDCAILKEKIAECMKIINNCITDLPISIGYVIIKDVFGSSIVASCNK